LLSPGAFVVYQIFFLLFFLHGSREQEKEVLGFHICDLQVISEKETWGVGWQSL
jgi:hypothetical protein